MLSNDDLTKLENKLWEAADQLRANSALGSTEYFLPVMGIIFLRHAYNRYLSLRTEIEKDLPKRGGVARALTRADFQQKSGLYLREASQFDFLLEYSGGKAMGTLLNEAMDAIEEDYPDLSGVLPKDYQSFPDDLIKRLLKIFNAEELRTGGGDLFGHIYEYFLMKFSMTGAHDSGEFFTPVSLVQTIVNVIEPDHGAILDPACGSGGMFVQTSHFIEERGGQPMRRVTFYGQEKTSTTIRLARMNLAVHGLEGSIKEGNTFYEDQHELLGKADFVMANPPFNVDGVDESKVKNDPRLPFGLPGVNKSDQVSNGNYLWISYFYSYLNEKGRAGFVMSSQASSAGRKEAEVREQLVRTRAVDVMIAIRSNFFYTRSVPCELWHFDRNKPKDRADKTLMLDARNIYRVVTRKVYDFSPEQLNNLTAVVWLYRGQGERFAGLVREYLETMLGEGKAAIEAAEAYRDAFFLTEGNEGNEDRKAVFQGLENLKENLSRDWRIGGAGTPCTRSVKDLTKTAEKLAPVAESCRDLIKDLDHLQKVSGAEVNKLAADKKADKKKVREAKAALKELDKARGELVEKLRLVPYFHKQVHWLLHRFPDGTYRDVEGLCKVVSIHDIEAADWSLTPGRYVGVAPQEEDEDFDFDETMRDIHTELADLNKEAAELAETIQKNYEGWAG